MKLLGAVILFALTVGTSSSCAQITSANNTTESASEPAISLTLSATPQQIKIGEQTQLSVSLKNISANEIYVFKDIGESDNYSYDVFVVDDKGVEAPTTPYYRHLKGKSLPSDPHMYYGNLSRHALPVEPGKELNSQIKLEYLRLLDHAGTYKIWVERVDGISNKSVKSNTVTVTVTP